MLAFFLDFLHFLLIATLLEFTCYMTGALLLRIVSLGRHKAPRPRFKDFVEDRSPGWFSLPAFVGLTFYIALIVIIAWLN